MQGGHERAWAEALAQEHAHQQELLAAFRGELGAFARECAAALAALDSCVAGLGGLADAVDTARTGYEHATLVLDVSRRLPGLAPTTVAAEDEAGLYERLADDGDLPPHLVSHAGELLRATPRRSDRALLQAVVDAAGARARIEQLIGPAPVAALAALSPLARRLPGLATIDRGEAGPAGEDLLRALEATAQLTAGEGGAEAAAAASLAPSVHAAVEHVQGAAHAVEEGRLQQVLAEARRRLEGDLAALRAVLDAAGDAPAEWRAARRAELDALTEEVREKLERVERTRRALAALLPHLRAVTRALATVEKLQAFDARLGAVAEAARLTLLLDVGLLLEAIVAGVLGPPPSARAGRSGSRTRLLAAAAVAAVVAAAGVAIALVAGGGSEQQAAPTTTAPPPAPATTTEATTTAPAPPPAPEVSPVEAVFDDAQRATFYSVAASATGQGEPTYAWHLTPPADDPGCNRFAPVAGSPGKAVWHHADTDGCNHAGTEHPGTVTVTITTTAWECTATFVGSETGTGSPAQRCRRLPG